MKKTHSAWRSPNAHNWRLFFRPVSIIMTLENVAEQLENIQMLLTRLVEREMVKDWYSVEEFARIVGRAEFTCREWCRHGRVKAEKKGSGRGAHASWAVSHDELRRFQREGLLPIQKTA